MLSKLIIKTFIKDRDSISNEKTRTSYGIVAGVVGIIINALLFIIKLSLGLILGSIAVTADAFNNLSDAASSIITILGFKLANMPADEEHPFGHGRFEYISAMIVSFMVILVGLQFIKSSVGRILSPTPVTFEIISFILILVSILFKIWLSKFNGLIGKKINSAALKAASIDALGDVITSSCVALSLVSSNFTTLPIDGYAGVLVSLMILYSGFGLVKDTLNPLLGEAPDPELVENIKSSVLNYYHILGVHDLIIHNYGPGRIMASIHAEVPCNLSIITIHEVIDRAEKEVSKKLKLYLVIHMDPINVDDKEVLKTEHDLLKILNNHPLIKSMHDFRIVGEGEIKNLIFDVVVDSNKKRKIMSDEELKNDIKSKVKEKFPEYNCVITIDEDYLH
ncbi:cation diffusion facilitator family transporter [Clostridium frigidicarnis]|uniref:Cation diffusion facilitator family transporter n=1 Tax=Clostridium frigidicarnis TaxID=84698 RepID=A0A1I0Z044_9CLOT|nr:cation diffusion facilitator family transporter [Clostridium frigidicarnis]SFB17990.1 cation diffusion facilitator family transporter [Clostridium frigidicarnis]